MFTEEGVTSKENLVEDFFVVVLIVLRFFTFLSCFNFIEILKLKLLKNSLLQLKFKVVHEWKPINAFKCQQIASFLFFHADGKDLVPPTTKIETLFWYMGDLTMTMANLAQ
jgi:hypothetical protein